MTTFLAEYSLVMSLQIFALIMPGPDYILVVSNATLQSRKHGIYTALGIALGIGLQVTACLFGLALLIQQSPLLFKIINILCAAYLAYLGAKLLHPATKTTVAITTVATTNNYYRSGQQGLFCNLLNPKALLFFLSLFTLIIDAHTPITWQIIYGITMMCTTFCWFTLVSLLITHSACQKHVQKAQRFLRPVFGIILLIYAIMLFIY